MNTTCFLLNIQIAGKKHTYKNARTVINVSICFKMSDFGVPYSYSPVIAGFEDHIASHTDSYKRFLEATKQGFLIAATNPAEASKILQPLVSKSDQDIDIEAAINYSKDAFGNEVDWGKIEASNVKQYLEWIYLHQLESEVVLVKDLIADLW